MKQKLNILTLKFGTKYGVDYVNRLYSGLKRNTTVDFDFYCYTERADGLHKDIIWLPLDPRCNTHWQKLEFHRENFLDDGDKCLILDIDWIITGNMDEILNYPLERGEFATVYRWWSDRRDRCPMNGGFQMFYAGDTQHLWDIYYIGDGWQEEYFVSGEVSVLGMGEQNFIHDHLNMPIKYLEPSWFGRVGFDDGINNMINRNWAMNIDPYDPFLLGDQLNDRVKMVHFTSDFSMHTNDNHISDHKWATDYWQ